jgi:D-sedoheptulose 7-phosphate isomerase
VKAICLSDNASILTAVSNDINYNSIFTQQLSILANPNDLLIIISASGNSSNLVSAVEASHSLGMKRFSMTGFDGGKIRELTFESNLHVPSQIGQYGLVEDVHMAICHIITECIRKS